MTPIDVATAQLRGALSRFGPPPTLLRVTAAEEVDEPAPVSNSPAAVGAQGVTADVPRLEDLPVEEDPAALIERAQAFVATHGVPRVCTFVDGTLCKVGATLCGPARRSQESLLTAEQVSGRENTVRGRVAVVTGGAQGFGEQLVRGLVRHGALVFIADLNRAGADALAEELNNEYGPVCCGASVDISDETSVRALVADVVANAGGLDLFVANAGVLKAGSVKEQSAADFAFVTNVNYNGFFLCAKHAATAMAAQNAAAPRDYLTDIVQINSKSGLVGSNKNGAYAGSKFGAIGLVQSFALELVENRIKVNALCPGNFLDGPLWSDPDRGLFVQYLRTGKVPGAKTVAEVRAAYEAKVPLGRGCTGEDVVKALLYVVEQQYETGQAVPVTGGQNMLK